MRLAMISALAGVFSAQAVAATTPEAAIDAIVSDYMAKTRTPGVSVAIGRGDAIRFKKGYGIADLESRTRVDPQTLFPTASTFKPITATAILRLAADGRLSLDDEVQKYCPAYPTKQWPVTIRQLLVHSGGVRHFTRDEIFNSRNFTGPSDVAKYVGESDLLFQPGSDRSYSNFGYSLLACAIEGASGKAFGDYIGDFVIGRAAMTDTRPDMIYWVIPNRARGYIIRTPQLTKQWDGLWQPAHLTSTLLDQPFRADAVDYSMEIGAGGYLSTPSDLVRFGLALTGERLLPKDALSKMLRPSVEGQDPVDGPIAWNTEPIGDRKIAAARVIGSDWTGSAGIMILPNRNEAISVMTNVGFNPPEKLIEDIWSAWETSNQP